MAGTALTIWYASPQEPHPPPFETAKGPEGDYYPGGASCKPWNLKSLPASEALKEREHCAEAGEKYRIDQENLDQQIRLVNAAEWNLGLLYTQVREGLVLAIATVGAFISALFAAWGAYRAYRAAESTLEHAQEVSDAELRPYLFVQSNYWTYEFKPNDPESKPKWRFDIVIENTGKTPAKRVLDNIQHRISPKGGISDNFDFAYDNKARNAGSIGPSQKIHAVRSISVADLTRIWKSEERMFLWGFFEYDGMRDKVRFRTECCWEITPKDDPSAHGAKIEAELTDFHNGSDETAKFRPQT